LNGAACAIRPQLALDIGGMGARSKNSYNDLTRRLGYEAAAADIQGHFLEGRRKEAEAAVPDALIDEISLVGPKERIRDQLQAWKELGRDHRVGSLVLTGRRRRRCASSPKPCYEGLLWGRLSELKSTSGQPIVCASRMNGQRA
jgi:hypothetical protein